VRETRNKEQLSGYWIKSRTS